MFEIYESPNPERRHIIATVPTFAEAKNKVEAMGVAFMEDDPDYEGCVDAYTKDGRVISIQPVGFKITA